MILGSNNNASPGNAPLFAYRFHKTTPVLDFGPRPAVKPGKGSRWIAWPVWAWRIVAPIPKQRPLNVFQRAVLQLAVAGKRTAEEQAELLGLDRELTALVITELQGRGALDEGGKVTRKGESILEEDSSDDLEVKSGYVFQDPFSHDLWPRFVEMLSYAETVFERSDSFPKLLRGTSGRPMHVSLHLVLPGEVMFPPRPDRVHIIDALQRSFQAHKRGRRGRERLDDEDPQSMAEVETARLSDQYLSRVDFVEEEPSPYFLLSRVYFPATEADTAGWRPCDPFGLGDSHFLRTRIEMRMPEDDNLANLISRVVGVEVETDKDGFKNFLARLNAEARDQVRHALTAGIERHEDLFKRLVTMERKWIEVSSAGEEATREAVGEFLTAAQTSLEHLFRHNLLGEARHGGTDILTKGSRARDYNRAIFNAAAEDCGFTTPLPDRLGHVKGGKVGNVLRGNMGSLRPLLLAALLVARRVPDHPVRRWAEKDPNFLVRLDDLAERRDQSAHASEAFLALEDAKRARETVFEAVALALGLPRRVRRDNGDGQ